MPTLQPEAKRLLGALRAASSAVEEQLRSAAKLEYENITYNNTFDLAPDTWTALIKLAYDARRQKRSVIAMRTPLEEKENPEAMIACKQVLHSHKGPLPWLPDHFRTLFTFLHQGQAQRAAIAAFWQAKRQRLERETIFWDFWIPEIYTQFCRFDEDLAHQMRLLLRVLASLHHKSHEIRYAEEYNPQGLTPVLIKAVLGAPEQPTGISSKNPPSSTVASVDLPDKATSREKEPVQAEDRSTVVEDSQMQHGESSVQMKGHVEKEKRVERQAEDAAQVTNEVHGSSGDNIDSSQDRGAGQIKGCKDVAADQTQRSKGEEEPIIRTEKSGTPFQEHEALASGNSSQAAASEAADIVPSSAPPNKLASSLPPDSGGTRSDTGAKRKAADDTPSSKRRAGSARPATTARSKASSKTSNHDVFDP